MKRRLLIFVAGTCCLPWIGCLSVYTLARLVNHDHGSLMGAMGLPGMDGADGADGIGGMDGAVGPPGPRGPRGNNGNCKRQVFQHGGDDEDC